MEDSTYHPDGVERVIALLKDTLGAENYTYFKGELLNTPSKMLPACMVTVPKVQIRSGATGQDDIVEQILIIIVLNKMDDVNGSQDTDLTEYRLQKIVYGQDATTREYLPNTVMYALRKYFTMKSDTVDNSIDVEFSPNARGETTIIPTQEAYITVTIGRKAMVASRE